MQVPEIFTFLVYFDPLLEEWFAVEKNEAGPIRQQLENLTTFHEVEASGYIDAIQKVRPTCSVPSSFSAPRGVQ